MIKLYISFSGEHIKDCNTDVVDVEFKSDDDDVVLLNRYISPIYIPATR